MGQEAIAFSLGLLRISWPKYSIEHDQVFQSMQGSATGEAIHFAAAIQSRNTFEALMVARDGPKDKEFFVSFK